MLFGSSQISILIAIFIKLRHTVYRISVPYLVINGHVKLQTFEVVVTLPLRLIYSNLILILNHCM